MFKTNPELLVDIDWSESCLRCGLSWIYQQDKWYQNVLVQQIWCALITKQRKYADQDIH